ncbi:hypothetical protein JP34_01090 [Gallibacterium anatis]|uniref:XRE family transcriptional regulator n=1 Tax=Gallibacterium anatis TaxID=750 RepID=UPI0005322862|nr:XRE family transcriptional regulator [Gallibacterium anatis]KGQ36112.1 hypothetical protein JP34_01090 [Gallibacterium anatis]
MASKFKNKSMIGNRIREQREKLGLTRPELAKAIDVSLSALQNWEINEREPQASMIITIAKELGVTPNYLLTGEEKQSIKEVNESLLEQKEIQEINLIPNDYYDFVSIDDYRNVRVSAGFGRFNEEQYGTPQTKVESAWVNNRGLKAKNLVMLTVDGDSMYPTLRDGEQIIVDRSQTKLREGKIFVINHQGIMWVKKIHFDFNGIKLISDNPTYPPISLSLDDIDALMVIGQVVRGYRDF